MSKLHVNHIKVRLKEIYSDLIDLDDVKHKKEEDVENHFLTRAYTAYTLQVLSGLAPEICSANIVDGYKDNGIDLIHYDSQSKNLWIIQSKFIKNGNGEPDSGEILKFTKGIRDLIDLKFERFNDKIKNKENDILSALDDHLVKFRIVLTYTGKDNICDNSNNIISDLLNELNDPSELATYQTFSLNSAHKSLVGGLEGDPIDAEIALSNWGFMEHPYKAFYGIINASNLASLWAENRTRLFSENIRDFVGFSDVNEDIINTIKNDPEHFYYFNNGITALCSSIEKKALSGRDRNSGYFVAKDFKIVNGAQTVGSIGSSFELGIENVDNTSAFIKIISLENCPDGFGTKITKASNTQNKIDKKDFVSLDPQQGRIKTELALEGITYHFKRTDLNVILDNENYTIEEATISLACFNSDVSLAVQAKREIGKLWDDITKKPYIDLFNSETRSFELIRTIKVFRLVNEILLELQKTSSGREKSHYIHSNRFILHIILNSISRDNILNPNFDFDTILSENFRQSIKDNIENSKNLVELKYPNSLIHQVYRNFNKCRELKVELNKN
ncbi:AIPR family protein [Tenacibaculum finnmarkense]|uniref:AIPR family protein n=1 Tax=Tenacibaculum finnmarkense TaxID=2781243 RepID=UPI001E436821|nr:AIPR family protein [Tenacibaculum finnmarkense]MCD8445674.1 AIPR family protein [Tenacibaculum finnmarkense genomovar ulcerans]MCD8448061.1 AIPR family protein [Tenacibaculum finnmarkense genomovar finnmarkense]MCG8806517.1 AIPR family protein [Tenacibaculum finnmarkense]MCG8857647.1 AIPR family protein [Tenacibaculum finnmarkense]